jgi:DNA-binding MarR family transcriptional regulator
MWYGSRTAIIVLMTYEISRDSRDAFPPLQIGVLLRFSLEEVRKRIYEGVVAAGFDDVRPAHVTLFRWPGPDGARPTEVAAAVQRSKQTVNDLLRDLERLGYLELEPDPTDNRARIIHLTERGKRLHKIAVGVHARIEREWAQIVGEGCFQQLRETLSHVVAVTSDRAAARPAS